MSKKKSNYYVDKDELRELVIKYNDLNPNETWDWLDRYIQTFETKYSNGTVDKQRLEDARKFVEYRREFAKNRKPLTGKELVDYEKNIVTPLFKHIANIINGRLAGMKIGGDLKFELDDIRSECYYQVIKYINRYDPNSDSSALAYITQIASNAARLYIKEYNDRANVVVIGLDAIENLDEEGTLDKHTRKFTKNID